MNFRFLLGAIARPALIGSAALCLSTALSWAGCHNKDRPAIPINLKIIPANPPPPGIKQFAVVLTWTSPQIRTLPTYHDIHVNDINGKAIPNMGVTGGAGSPAGSRGHPEVGQFALKNFPQVPPPNSEFRISMRARTKAGTEGCISAQESEVVRFCGTPDHPLVCN